MNASIESGDNVIESSLTTGLEFLAIGMELLIVTLRSTLKYRNAAATKRQAAPTDATTIRILANFFFIVLEGIKNKIPYRLAAILLR